MIIYERQNSYFVKIAGELKPLDPIKAGNVIREAQENGRLTTEDDGDFWAHRIGHTLGSFTADGKTATVAMELLQTAVDELASIDLALQAAGLRTAEDAPIAEDVARLILAYS